MKISISAKELSLKLGVNSISDAEKKQIQQWIDSITVEIFDADLITSEKFRTEQFDFSRIGQKQSYDVIKRISKAYRHLFTNTYDEFIFYPSEGRKYSLHELLHIVPVTIFSDEAIYSFPLDCLCKKSLFDKSIDECPMFCHDPETTFQNIKQKLEQQGHVVIIGEKETGQIVGFAFGYQSSLINAWSLEEWVHPFVYSRFGLMLKEIQESNHSLYKIYVDKYFNDFYKFLFKFNKLVKNDLNAYGLPDHREDFEPDDRVYVFNAIATHPQIRRISKPSELCGTCLDMVDWDIKNNMLGLGEAVFQSNAYKMFQIGGMKDIYGVLNQSSNSAKKGDNILMVGPLSSVLEAALLPQREFMKRYIHFHRKMKKRKM